ncbi:ficolin-1-A-like [Littorina saxatilis]|uniref:Fibrinogen C-terminal domain-containing protein n=1 Tax=Littorina saxatilis TaxID=31220 RepID=A0AAN9G5P6_9CAEN
MHKWYKSIGYATYSGFYVEDVSHNFTLRFDNFTGGNAGDSLSLHRGFQFSTKDRDNDHNNCAKDYHGAWWYRKCYVSNLNGDYNGNGDKQDGVFWFSFGGSNFDTLRFTEMKIRPM